MNNVSKKVFGFVAVVALAGCVGEPGDNEASFKQGYPAKYGGLGATEQQEEPAKIEIGAIEAGSSEVAREVKVEICDSDPAIDASWAKIVEDSMEGSAPSVREIVITKADAGNDKDPAFMTLKVAVDGANPDTTPTTILCPTGVAHAAPLFRVQLLDAAGSALVDTTSVQRIEELKIVIAKDGTQTVSDIVIVFDARAAAGAPAAGANITARIDRLPRTAHAAPTSNMTLSGSAFVEAVEDLDELGTPVRKMTFRASHVSARIEKLAPAL